jgi:hypothetical protein
MFYSFPLVFVSVFVPKVMGFKLKRPPTEWKKIFGSYISEKGLITRIYREFKKVNSQKINDPVKKGANEMDKEFSKEVQMAKKHMKKCPPSLAIKEMQIKTTLRFHFTSVRIAAIMNTNNTNIGEDVGKKEPSYIADGNVS